MKINLDILANDLVLSSKNTSNRRTYSCQYINAIDERLTAKEEDIQKLANRGHFSAKWAPNMSKVSSIDTGTLGFYSINGGTDTPVTGHNNDNWFIINIPNANGSSYNLQIGFSLWAGNSSMGGTKIWWRVGTGVWRLTS